MSAWRILRVGKNIEVKVDALDYCIISRMRWHVTFTTHGLPRIVTSIRNGKSVRKITLGRFLMQPQAQQIVFRINIEDPFDYRRSALFVGTRRELVRLSPKQRAARTSKFKGVSLAENGLWRASIEVSGKSINLGRYPSEKEAAQAYDQAILNKIDGKAFRNFSQPKLATKGVNSEIINQESD